MSERRTFLVLIAVVLAQLVLLTARVPYRSGDDSTLEVVALRLLAPPARWLRMGLDELGRLRETVRTQVALRGENNLLRSEIRELRLEQARYVGVDQQLRNLARALDYVVPASGGVRLADVVYLNHVSWLRTLVVHLPPASGMPSVEAGSSVTSHDGLVGRVLQVAGPYARVQLITDRASGVGAMIERTRRQGIVHGADAGALSLDYVPLQADVRVGDRVLTAGIDGIYPPGIAIGTVAAVNPGSELFHRIRVAPAVDFGLLDQVYILLRDSVPAELKGASTSASP